MSPDFIRNRITELRLKKGIAETRMSLDLGHSRSYMQGISNGRALPSMTEFLAICDYFEVTPKEFFDAEGSNSYLLDKLMDEAEGISDDDALLLINMVKRLKQNT